MDKDSCYVEQWDDAEHMLVINRGQLIVHGFREVFHRGWFSPWISWIVASGGCRLST